MLKHREISIVVLIFLSFTAVSSAAQAQNNATISRTQSGQIIQRTRRSSGGVTDKLPYAADEILVRFKDTASPSAMSLAHSRHQASPIKRFRHVRNLERVKLPPGVSLDQALKSYRGNPDVLYAEPNYIVKAFGVPNDPLFPSQWNLHNTGQNGGTLGADIKAVEAWNLTTGSKDVVVAVIDSGVDYTHEDLAANMWRNEADCNSNGIDDDGNGYIDDCYGINTANDNSDPMDDDGHGTHVAGIIGAVGNNSLGVVGVNWNVKIMACKFLDADGFGTAAEAIECLDYVRTMKERGVNIVATNNSWGSTSYSQALRDAIDRQREAGILFIAAAGDDPGNNDTDPIYPASYYLPNIISVAATDPSDDLMYPSVYGSATVHIGAPGVGILSTTPGNTYSFKSGTSMAAAHVTGVAALVKAQNQDRDWKAIKNLILAGGDDKTFFAPTITGKRLNAANSLSCFNSPVVARLQPTADLGNGDIHVGSVINLSALHINCAVPNGEVNVTISPSGEVIELRDDGVGFDQVPDDGIYSGQWTATSGGTFTLTFPDGAVVNVDVDPDLKPGFPVKAFTYFGFFDDNAIHTLVGNIDKDPKLEIVVTSIPSGPLYAWKSDGSPVPGWPLSESFGAAYPALGQLSTQSPGFEIVASYARDYPNTDSTIAAYNGSGTQLPGWPKKPGSMFLPPTTVDIDGDGIDEIFISVGTQVYGYRADGSLLSGWPVTPMEPLFGGFAPVTTGPLAAGDLDGDGRPEIIFTYGGRLFAYHHDGTLMNGFPVSGIGIGALAIGDVDGDGHPEIILMDVANAELRVVIVSNEGVPKRAINLGIQQGDGGALALADLDGDGIPEIIIQTTNGLTVIRGDGSVFPGWPVTWGPANWITSAPVVGDVDGDGLPDIVVVLRLESGDWGEVRAYNRTGTLLPRFPKRLMIERGAVPAIADLDLDGRNEIIVTAGLTRFVAGDYNKVWVYDLGGPPHGAVQWGQLMGGPKHQGMYQGGFNVPHRLLLSVRKEGTGTGTVSSVLPGINCGNACSAAFEGTASVTLTATAAPGSVFLGWYGGGCSGTGNCTVTVASDTRITATFNSQTVTTTILNVASLNPSAAVNITTTPPDIIGAGGGNTPFNQMYHNNTFVTLTAPATASGNVFQKWLRDGEDWATTSTTQVLMAANHTMTAVYVAQGDTTPPVTRIDGGPTGTISNTSATFTWSGTDNLTPTEGLTYAYRLDPFESNFSDFTSTTTKTYSNLPPNRIYTFFVKGRDQAGNETPIPASRIFRVFIDSYGPSIVIQSPVNNQVVNSNTIVVSGTATDSDPYGLRGDNGVSLVTVNGVVANGATAVGSGTANWSVPITLNPGLNPITVMAWDNSPNHNLNVAQVFVMYQPTEFISVLCAEDSLQVAVDSAQAGDTILVSGTCNENILVRKEKERIMIDGAGAGAGTRATVNGNGSGPTLDIRGKGITIQNFTITGGSDGVVVNRGSNAVLNNNNIHDTSGNGVVVNQLAIGVITNNTIQNNPGAGIWVSESSTARIGFNLDTETTASSNTIQNNTVGVLVSNTSSARIIGNDISNNTGDGIDVLRNSEADIANNTINGNEGDGIEIGEDSFVHLGEDSGPTIYSLPNATTVNNAGFGVACTTGGLADGRQGTLTGTVGAISFDSSCMNSLSP